MENGARDLVWMELQTAAAVLDAELNSSLEAQAGMSSTDFQALWTLANAADRSATMSSLAARLSMSASGTTRLADRLVRRGWAERRQDSQSRRVWFLCLTEEGAAATRQGYHVALRVRAQRVDRYLDDGEVAQLRGLLGKLLGHLEVEDVSR